MAPMGNQEATTHGGRLGRDPGRPEAHPVDISSAQTPMLTRGRDPGRTEVHPVGASSAQTPTLARGPESREDQRRTQQAPGEGLSSPESPHKQPHTPSVQKPHNRRAHEETGRYGPSEGEISTETARQTHARISKMLQELKEDVEKLKKVAYEQN